MVELVNVNTFETVLILLYILLSCDCHMTTTPSATLILYYVLILLFIAVLLSCIM